MKSCYSHFLINIFFITCNHSTLSSSKILGTIKAKLLAGGYDSNTSGVLADVKLTFENCMTYAQDKTSVWYLTAERMIATAEEWFSGGGSKKHKKGSKKLCTAKPSTAKHLEGAADQQKKRKATTRGSSGLGVLSCFKQQQHARSLSLLHLFANR